MADSRLRLLNIIDATNLTIISKENRTRHVFPVTSTDSATNRPRPRSPDPERIALFSPVLPHLALLKCQPASPYRAMHRENHLVYQLDAGGAPAAPSRPARSPEESACPCQSRAPQPHRV